jgi:predicted anti-sigma-YlaC factor YlaD
MSALEDITCREIVQLVTDYLEGALSPERTESVELHLSYCGGCANYLDQMRAAIRLSGTLTEDAVPPNLQAELVRAFGKVGR